VSRLIIFDEEDTNDVNLIPDLSRFVQVVKSAVDNLVTVGHETCSTSTDDVLRADMPQALERVNQASGLLIDAAHRLKYQPCSIQGRKMLIEGARCNLTFSINIFHNEIKIKHFVCFCFCYTIGILQGISTLLLTFDQSEVRKIVIICQHVLNHLSYVEMIESVEQLVDFVKVKNLICSSVKQQRVRERCRTIYEEK
jgi:vinculin